MKFKVPIDKPSTFNSSLFYFLSDSMSTLTIDNKKWPDTIVFNGAIGKELYDIIIEQGWDFSKFKMETNQSILNNIIIKYSKPLDEIDDPNIKMGDNLDGRIISGIPNDETINKIHGSAISDMFKIERKINPFIKIKLTR